MFYEYNTTNFSVDINTSEERGIYMENSIKSFENKRVRAAWNEDEEKWYFSVIDIVGH